MGIDLANVDEMNGAIFMGVGGSTPMIWFLLALVLCIFALLSGQKHEHDAYKRLEKITTRPRVMRRLFRAALLTTLP